MMNKNKAAEDFPEKLYQLKYERLKPGDILATTVPDSFISGAIRYVTKGEFSHVALCCIEGALMEAVGGGVFLTVPSRFFVKNLDYIRIYRPKPEVASFCESSELINKLTEKCMEMYLSDYSKIKAMGVAFSKINLRGNAEGYFCSELVSAAYLNCGIELCASLPPDKTSPKDVYSSNKLMELNRDEFFKEVTRNEITHLYGEEIKITDLPLEKKVLSLHESFEQAAKMLKKNKKEGSDEFGFTINKQLLANKMVESELSIYADKEQRKKEIDRAVEVGLGHEKIAQYQEAIKKGEESMEWTRTVIEGFWRMDETPDKTSDQISSYLSALQTSIGLIYINYMIVHENIEYLKSLLNEPAQ